MKTRKRSRRRSTGSVAAVLRAALRKTPRIHFAKLQAAREASRDHDVKRLVGGLATPEELRREAQCYTDEQLKTFTLANFESLLGRCQ